MLRLMLREASLPRKLARTPEPTAEMASPESIAGFDEQGAASLLPIYRFNALAISRLAPHGAQLVDLGCGTGRFLAYLAAHRPDLKILGVDAAADMVLAGRRHLAETGLDGRVSLTDGDMRQFHGLLPSRTDLVSSIFSLHHLTTRGDLLACLREIAAVIGDRNARLWIFDHARPRRDRTAVEVPEIFTPDASPAFRADSRNSLRASWSFTELGTALRETLPVAARGARSRLLPLYQIHWTQPGLPANAAPWVEGEAPPALCRDARRLSLLFRNSPGPAARGRPRLF